MPSRIDRCSPEASNSRVRARSIRALTIGQVLSRCTFNDMMPNTKALGTRVATVSGARLQVFHPSPLLDIKGESNGYIEFFLFCALVSVMRTDCSISDWGDWNFTPPHPGVFRYYI